jgi:hypothetical protein
MGSGIVIALQNLLADKVGSWVTVIIGAIFVVCVLAFRKGVVGELQAFLERRRRRQIGGAAQRDHQMRKIAAHAHTFDQGIDGRGRAVAGVALETHMLLHPVADRPRPAVTQRQVAELAVGQRQQTVRLAIAAG